MPPVHRTIAFSFSPFLSSSQGTNDKSSRGMPFSTTRCAGRPSALADIFPLDARVHKKSPLNVNTFKGRGIYHVLPPFFTQNSRPVPQRVRKSNATEQCIDFDTPSDITFENPVTAYFCALSTRRFRCAAPRGIHSHFPLRLSSSGSFL